MGSMTSRTEPMTRSDLNALPFVGRRAELVDGVLVVSPTTADPMTRVELDALPNDGRRHELIDGVLIVSPAPTPRHQHVVAELFLRLKSACPDELVVLFAPLDVAVGDITVMEPDLLVARPSDFSEKDLPVAPVMAVEVLSPSTRSFDLNVKRERYEAAGTVSYWVIDPDEPRILAWDLVDGAYRQVADSTEPWTATLPFPVTVDPAALVSRR